MHTHLDIFSPPASIQCFTFSILSFFFLVLSISCSNGDGDDVFLQISSSLLLLLFPLDRGRVALFFPLPSRWRESCPCLDFSCVVSFPFTFARSFGFFEIHISNTIRRKMGGGNWEMGTGGWGYGMDIQIRQNKQTETCEIFAFASLSVSPSLFLSLPLVLLLERYPISVVSRLTLPACLPACYHNGEYLVRQYLRM